MSFTKISHSFEVEDEKIKQGQEEEGAVVKRGGQEEEDRRAKLIKTR